MNHLDWAEREVELAIRQKGKDNRCLELALKLYSDLVEGCVSGCAINTTFDIFTNLVNNQPLSPIEDKVEEWVDSSDIGEKDHETYRSIRFPSLFKDVYPDGTVIYVDICRYVCIDINYPDIPFTNGTVAKILNDLYPINMPYMPDEDQIKVYCYEFEFTNKHGIVCNALGVLHGMKNGKFFKIDRYFIFDDTSRIEVTLDEFREMEKRKIGE